MSTFVHVLPGPLPKRAHDFEQAFLARERLLYQAAGFRRFELVRRDRSAQYVVVTT